MEEKNFRTTSGEKRSSLPVVHVAVLNKMIDGINAPINVKVLLH